MSPIYVLCNINIVSIYSLLESSSAGPRPGRLKGRACNQGGSRGCDDQPGHDLVAQRLKAEHMGDDGSGRLEGEEEEEEEELVGEERGSITVGSCVARDYTMTMRR